MWICVLRKALQKLLDEMIRIVQTWMIETISVMLEFMVADFDVL
ncbi:MAG: hypothetical protein OXF09_00420 [Hyphomicrobiales bacterium]|nr:hypothetical protein [Hyphomicrobiales bacterium]